MHVSLVGVPQLPIRQDPGDPLMIDNVGGVEAVNIRVWRYEGRARKVGLDGGLALLMCSLTWA